MTGRMNLVDYSSIQLDGYKTLKEGDDVEFDIVQGQKRRPGGCGCPATGLCHQHSLEALKTRQK